MPPYSFHLLQLLDVGYFIVLKRAYGQLVESKTRLDVNHIDKFDFLIAYPNARIALTDDVLSKLNIYLSPLPPCSSAGSIFSSKTPKTFQQLQKQALSIKKRSKKAKKPTHPYRSCVQPDYQRL